MSPKNRDENIYQLTQAVNSSGATTEQTTKYRIRE